MSNYFLRILFSIISFLFLFEFSDAQFSGSNLLEYQHGGLPSDTVNFSSIYDRAGLRFNSEHLNGGLTLEQFHSPYDERNYTKLTQYNLHIIYKPLDVRIGNFYETLGRGLLLRSFEVPGAILEDLSYRSRHYFHRDIYGFNVRYRSKRIKSGILYGKPLNYQFPPSGPESGRRPDIVEAAYGEFAFRKNSAGAAVLRIQNQSGDVLYSMVHASGSLNRYVSYYLEAAKDIKDYGISSFNENIPFGIYASLNLSINNAGASLEYKNYNQFLIGSGTGEPPSLIKEHSYRLLNRSTHVLQPSEEQGYQLELYYSFPDLSVLTFNNAYTLNRFAQTFRYQEYFLQYEFRAGTQNIVKIFADYAEDPFKSESNRLTAGTSQDWNLGEVSKIAGEAGVQVFDRSGKSIRNQLYSLGYGYKTSFNLSIIFEVSNDDFISGDRTFWIGSNLYYRITPENSLYIFAGKRRGGPACNAGICYEIPDFKGLEIRLVSRF